MMKYLLLHQVILFVLISMIAKYIICILVSAVLDALKVQFQLKDFTVLNFNPTTAFTDVRATKVNKATCRNAKKFQHV